MHQQCNCACQLRYRTYNQQVPRPNQTGSLPFTAWQRFLLRLLPFAAAWLIRALGATLRMDEVLAPQAHPADRDATAALYPFWHNCLLLAAYRYRNLGIRILISPSFDGELIARTVARLGFVPVRGSSSRGGAAGLLALSRALASGYKCAITADGPRGPVYVAKPGAAAVAANAAHRTSAAEQKQAQVSAFYLHPHRAWRLRSWDGFLIPKPFSRVTVAWAAPLAGNTPDLPQALQEALQQVSTIARSGCSAVTPGN